jgi:class 3 adenylate cyclase
MAAEGARAVRLALVLLEALRRLKFLSAVFGVAGDMFESTVLRGVIAHVLFEVFGRKESYLKTPPVAAPQHSGGATLVHLVVPTKVSQRQLKSLLAQVAHVALSRLLLRLHVGLDTGDCRLGFVSGCWWGRPFPS